MTKAVIAIATICWALLFYQGVQTSAPVWYLLAGIANWVAGYFIKDLVG